jgi:hypothetical protein
MKPGLSIAGFGENPSGQGVLSEVRRHRPCLMATGYFCGASSSGMLDF